MSHSKKKDTSSHPTYDVIWFSNRMQEKFAHDVATKHVSYEAHLLYQDEIDEFIIPQEYLQQLPNPLLTQLYHYVDKQKQEWLLALVIDEITRQIICEVVLKNGKVISRQIFTER